MPFPCLGAGSPSKGKGHGELTRLRSFTIIIFRGSPIPLLKTASRKSNWPFHASRKIRKTASRSQKKASNHVSRKNAKAKALDLSATAAAVAKAQRPSLGWRNIHSRHRLTEAYYYIAGARLGRRGCIRI